MGATCGAADSSGPELDYGSTDVNAIREKFEQAGQGHVFNAWDDMDDREKQQFLNQCQQFDVNKMNTLFDSLVMRPQA